MKKRSKKLMLSKDTIKNLRQESLTPVNGGVLTDSCPSGWTCARQSCLPCPHEV